MSSKVSLNVKGISKTFRIFDNTRDMLRQIIPFQRKKLYKELYALSNVSFQVNKGETVGIIGKNGAGKSTLLQILCGTSRATSGQFEVQGRVAALLELGSGFSPQFSGRENVYMNATILGLSKKEINAKFDDILAFSEIGEFIDRPVRTYSSGMYMRLAFSVAISVDPDVLIVDEALSVGDFSFRNKCYGRIREMKESGVTILFVSHGLNTVETLCDRALWLEKGELVDFGDAVRVCQDYASSIDSHELVNNNSKLLQEKTGFARFENIDIGHPDTVEVCNQFEVGNDIRITFCFRTIQSLGEMQAYCSIFDQEGDRLICHSSIEKDVLWAGGEEGLLLSGSIVLENNVLSPGRYYMVLAIRSKDNAICFARTKRSPCFVIKSNHHFPIYGKVSVPCKWSINEVI